MRLVIEERKAEVKNEEAQWKLKDAELKLHQDGYGATVKMLANLGKALAGRG